MDELIQAMSIPELKDFKKAYKDNESVCKIIEGYIEVKLATEALALEQMKFAGAIAKMADKLPHPDDVHNVYLAWQEVEEEDTTQDVAEVVTITDKIPVLDKDNKIVEEAVTHEENRYPMHKLHKWVVTLNKGFTVNRSGSGNGTPNSSKRAITVSKRGEANPSQLELVGHFATASKACEHLHLACAGNLGGSDSGTRVLQREGLFLEPYEGTEYTSS